MDYQGFSTRGEHRCDRAASWRRINARYFGELAVDAMADDAPEADLLAFEVGPLRMLRIDAPAHRVWRSSSATEMPMDSSYKLVLQLQGHAEIRQGQRAFCLRRGDWSFYDPRVPYSVTNFERMDLLVVQVPHAHLRGFKVPSLHTCEASSSGTQGMYAVLGSFLGSMAEQLPSLPNGVGQSLSETVLGLLASCMATHQSQEAEACSLPSVLRARVRQYVQTHLADTDLSIDGIAQAMRCSKRYLHRVFEDENISWYFIWQTRLERCQQEIRERAAERPMVSQIAFAWGFNSSAHFCRMFKKQFGETPSEYLQRLARAA